MVRTTAERLLALETGLQKLQEGETATAIAIVGAMACVLDQMVDDGTVSAETRRQIWLRFERAAGEIDAKSPSVSNALRRAIPQNTLLSTLSQAPQPRRRKRLLQVPSQRPETDQ